MYQAYLIETCYPQGVQSNEKHTQQIVIIQHNRKPIICYTLNATFKKIIYYFDPAKQTK